MKIFYKGFNYSQDGIGNRLVYHLSGCNMHCLWCSNPEGMDKNYGKDVSVDEIVKEAISCKMMFFDNGGVTFTGGEATLQFNELKEVLIKLKENNINTTIETNGTCKRLKELLPFIDYLIMDFKHYDSEILKRYTKMGNEIIKENYIYNCNNKVKQHIRIPLIKNINTASPQKFVEFFSKYDTSNTVFEFLPYHEYGKGKWKEPYLINDGFITKEILNSFAREFKKSNLKVINT